ncbi:MAG: asparagine synthase [Rhodocyclales bacterium GT-UBC]|nr:MAG: asparagine synthase [Rhodocyclales bacterium GT-UBC]
MRFEINLADLNPALPCHHDTPEEWSRHGILATTQGARIDLASDQGLFGVLVGQANSPEQSKPLSAKAILGLYASQGKRFLDGLRGRYAIAVIDSRQRTVWLANDRMAVNGWCYRLSPGRIIFSDRADQIGEDSPISRQALLSYLIQHVIPAPATIFEEVSRLPAGHLLRVSEKGCELAPHWVPTFSEPAAPDFAALKDEFRALIEASVAQIANNRPGETLGTFLSGGTDSSTVSGTLQKLADRPIRAYSIGFDVNGYDEMEFARIAARHFGIDHREYYLTPEDVRTGMPLVATHYDQPFGNSSAVAAYHCARVAQTEGITTLLAGDGGDELFGGNARYAKQRIFSWYANIPAPLRHLVMEPLFADNALAGKIPLVSKVGSYIQQARVPLPDRMNMYNLLQRLGLQEVLTPAFLANVSAEQIEAEQRATYQACSSPFQVNRMLAYDWKYTLADNDLPKVLGTTGLAGIQVEFPLLADALIDFSARLPAEYKLHGLQLRWFFKEALRDFLPGEILSKKKQGFGLPFGVWALQHDALRKLAESALASFGERGVIRPAFIQRLIKDLLPAYPGYYGELAWIITMLEFWLQDRVPQFRLDD